MRNLLILMLCACGCIGTLSAQQLSILEIDQMPNKPALIEIRDWKKVAKDYDNLVFDTSKTGDNLPLTMIHKGNGVNYPGVNTIGMSSFVGQSSLTNISESVNILPAIVGASLVGVDKTNHMGINWIPLVKDFFNIHNGLNIYLNTNKGRGTGVDWWYEVMPNVFFYQLYSLYPDGDPDFYEQFISIADRKLEVVEKLGGTVNPWMAPNMNYRAFNILTGKPLETGVPEPEAAGSIAWILYQAYLKTNDIKYLQGAELALDFLSDFDTNPSYELQLPYGILAAARLNAELDTDLDLEKMMNWAFSKDGNVRDWGCIVGKWGNYEVSGLIGGAEKGDGYAFIMNGFQHAGTLAPVAKYDKRYSHALAKWLLHLTNSTRFFYHGFMNDKNMDPISLNVARQIDPDQCLPYEAMKENWDGKNPYAMGDAINAGWAPTNLGLYSGASVGYLASIVEKTNVEGILLIDLNVTDFSGENTYKRYLYYNPTDVNQSVDVGNLPQGNFDIYDIISETTLKSNVSGSTSINVPANGVCQIVIYPTGSQLETEGRILRVKNGGIIDYNKGNDFLKKIRIKAFSADAEKVPFGAYINFNCFTSNNTESATYSWYVNGTLLTENKEEILHWQAPKVAGEYTIKCIVKDGGEVRESDEIKVNVYDSIYLFPIITDINVEGGLVCEPGHTPMVQAEINTEHVTIKWDISDGTLTNNETLSPIWKLPRSQGAYTITLTVTNEAGSASKSIKVLVKNQDNVKPDYTPIVYYPFDGDALNAAKNAYHATIKGAKLTTDPRGDNNKAYRFTSDSQYISAAANNDLNTPYMAVALWVRVDETAPDREQYVVSHGSWEGRFKMSISDHSKLRFTVKSSSGIVDVEDPTPLNENEFAHYVGTFNGELVELYRDGSFVDGRTLGGQMGNTNQDLVFAREFKNNTYGYYFLGAVDEVRLYDTDLSPEYIKKLPTLFNDGSSIDNETAEILVSVYSNLVQVGEDIIVNTSIENDILKNSQIRIYNLLGECVKNVSIADAETRMNILTPGYYILQLKSEKGFQKEFKLIVK